METSYYSSGLFEDICFQCGKVPEDEFDESEKVSVNEIYYHYCDECYTTVSNKKDSRDVKFQQKSHVTFIIFIIYVFIYAKSRDKKFYKKNIMNRVTRI